MDGIMLEEALERRKSVLVVWDVQNMLVNNIFDKDEFMKNLTNLIDAARKSEIPVFYTKITPYQRGFESPVARLMPRPRSSAPKPEDWDLAVHPRDGEIVLNKNTSSIFVGTNFELLLRNSGRTTIAFTGIATELGVETSARHALALGFVPVIVADAVSSRDKARHERSLQNMRDLMVVLNSGEIAEYWK